jgi:3-oxoacyl-[acyl-carrier protein] reductase
MNILITGGSSGLGESITRKLGNDLSNVVYFTYNQSELNAKKIESNFSNVFAIKCDFKKESDIEALKNRVAELNVDILINNAYAGEAIKSYFHKIPPKEFLSDFRENLMPTIILTQSVIDSFRKKKSGKIITILTSFLVNTPPIGSAVYVANKAYLQELTKVWAVENVKYNIVSNAVSPSFMLTNFTKDTDDRVLDQIKENHPLKQILSTEEVADTVFFLINASNQINGINIVINAAVNIK